MLYVLQWGSQSVLSCGSVAFVVGKKLDVLLLLGCYDRLHALSGKLIACFLNVTHRSLLSSMISAGKLAKLGAFIVQLRYVAVLTRLSTQVEGEAKPGSRIKGRILDVNKKDGIVDLTLKPPLVAAAPKKSATAIQPEVTCTLHSCLETHTMETHTRSARLHWFSWEFSAQLLRTA